jgi:hypothetical protein
MHERRGRTRLHGVGEGGGTAERRWLGWWGEEARRVVVLTLGLSVDAQPACVVSVKSFLAFSVSCLAMLILAIRILVTKACARAPRQNGYVVASIAASTCSGLSVGGRCVRRGSVQRMSCMCVRVRVCVCVAVRRTRPRAWSSVNAFPLCSRRERALHPLLTRKA